MRVLIVYDRANKWGGAERFLLNILTIFPNAELATSLYDQSRSKWANQFTKVHTSFLQRISFLRAHHEVVPYLMPMAFESLQIKSFDLILSVSSESAKGVLVPIGIPHLNICLSPTRYLWHDYHTYFKNTFLKFLTYPIVAYLRSWDRIAAMRPDRMVAISSTVQDRIRLYYNREASVIYPPIDSDYWLHLQSKKVNIPFQKYFLVVSRLVPSKRVDIAIQSCTLLEQNLVIVGTGGEYNTLKSLSTKNIYFLSDISDDELKYLYLHAYAFLCPQEEDFGLSILEAQLFGLPVIAYKKGGASEIVQDGVTGNLFKSQTIAGCSEAIKRFNKKSFDKTKIVANAKKYSLARFKKNLMDEVKKTIG